MPCWTAFNRCRASIEGIRFRDHRDSIGRAIRKRRFEFFRWKRRGEATLFQRT